jgi:flavin-dependent dehydrogenase
MSNTYNWHDIQSRSAKFAAKWVTETDEKGEAKTFWDDFLREIFNIERRQFMNFEKTSRRASTKQYTSKGKSLADLYDPLSMPPDLKAAHDALDKSVDECYGKTKFTSDAKRVEYLFELYDGLVKAENQVKKAK